MRLAIASTFFFVGMYFFIYGTVGYLRQWAKRTTDEATTTRCRADIGEPCSCRNGIGCVHVPYEEW